MKFRRVIGIDLGHEPDRSVLFVAPNFEQQNRAAQTALVEFSRRLVKEIAIPGCLLDGISIEGPGLYMELLPPPRLDPQHFKMLFPRSRKHPCSRGWRRHVRRLKAAGQYRSPWDREHSVLPPVRIFGVPAVLMKESLRG